MGTSRRGGSATIYHAVVELDLGGDVVAVDVTGLRSNYTYLYRNLGGGRYGGRIRRDILIISNLRPQGDAA